MELFPKEIEKKIPRLLETDGSPIEDVIIHVKFFSPLGTATWYVTEFDPKTKEFFGYCSLNNKDWEWGNFYLDELQNIKLSGGFRIERDILFTPKKFKEIKQ